MSQNDATNKIKQIFEIPDDSVFQAIDIAYSEDFVVASYICVNCQAIMQDAKEHERNSELCSVQAVIGS